MAAVGAGSGVVLGGLLTDTIGWPWIFLINVPIGMVALAVSPRLLPGDSARPSAGDAGRRLDPLGALTGTGALLAAVFVASELPVSGLDRTTLFAGVLTAVLAVLFWLDQRRHPWPILPPTLLRHAELRAGAIANALVGAAHVPAFVLLTLMLQDVMGYSPTAAGIAVLPVALVNMVAARTVVPWALGRFGPRPVLAAGMGLLAAGLAGWAIFLGQDAGYFTAVLPFAVLFAVGLPAVFVASTASPLRSAPEDQRGTASGVLNTAQRIGASLGVTGALLISASWDAAPGTVGALSSGLRGAFGFTAAIAVVGMCCAFVLFERSRIAVGGTAAPEAANRP